MTPSKETSDDSQSQALNEVVQKVEASLQSSIDRHVNSTDFSPSHGLDFLDTKNHVMLSYLIELAYNHRNNLTSTNDPESKRRLLEMRTVLDKMRGLEKKLRYQIDKLLNSESTRSFASSEDPLQFRPRGVDDDDNSDEDNSVDESEDDESRGETKESNRDLEDNTGDDNIDDDLATARRTLALAKEKRGETADDGIYRAPRHTAVPYSFDKEDRAQAKEKRRLRGLRASEVAQTLRHSLSEAPETEDASGGAVLGQQRAASRRLAERDSERIKFEEDNLMRLTMTRAEKKERKRLMREETSNLSAIADLGNLVRESGSGKKKRPHQQHDYSFESEPPSRSSRKPKAHNSLQAALYGEGGNGDGKKKAKKR